MKHRLGHGIDMLKPIIILEGEKRVVVDLAGQELPLFEQIYILNEYVLSRQVSRYCSWLTELNLKDKDKLYL